MLSKYLDFRFVLEVVFFFFFVGEEGESQLLCAMYCSSKGFTHLVRFYPHTVPQLEKGTVSVLLCHMQKVKHREVT